jgi:hypothetical protein
MTTATLVNARRVVKLASFAQWRWDDVDTKGAIVMLAA